MDQALNMCRYLQPFCREYQWKYSMRVLMSALHPEGGIRTFFRYIYGHPVYSDVSITLVAPDNGLSEFLGKFVPENRIQVVPAKTGKYALIRQLRNMAGSGKFDFIHSHGFSAGILTEISRTGLGIPHMMTGHDVFMQAQFKGLSGKFHYQLLSLLFRRMTAIHTVGEDARQNLLNFFPEISPDKVHGILNGVDTRYFRDGIPTNVKGQIGLGDEVPLIGFFGRFMGQKGFLLLVDAVGLIRSNKMMRDVPHVVTFGWNGFIREDYAYLGNKGLGDLFHQMEQSHEIPGMLKGVDLVVMPSRWEACPLLAMEALAAGVPIIGSDCIGLREVLTGSPASQFRTGDVHMFAEAIVDEFTRLPERKEKFMDYQPQAVERFDFDRTARSLVKVYTGLAKSREM
jgi:glycosyltransferase involved in cell wall biosynthesis